jgi:hypothetical protein
MKEQLIKLMVQIDKIIIGKIIIEYDTSETDNKTDIEIHVDGKNCCMPSACVSNCGECDANVKTTLSLPEPEKCCSIM